FFLCLSFSYSASLSPSLSFSLSLSPPLSLSLSLSLDRSLPPSLPPSPPPSSFHLFLAPSSFQPDSQTGRERAVNESYEIVTHAAVSVEKQLWVLCFFSCFFLMCVH